MPYMIGAAPEVIAFEAECRRIDESNARLERLERVRVGSIDMDGDIKACREEILRLNKTLGTGKTYAMLKIGKIRPDLRLALQCLGTEDLRALAWQAKRELEAEHEARAAAMHVIKR
jgi:hypothetical protein